MINAAERLFGIKEKMLQAEQKAKGLSEKVKLVAVSKTVNTQRIIPFIRAGQKIFAENKLQEAKEKWQDLRSQFQDLTLHFIGSLQSGKVKEAIAFFDVIETIDREKIAKKAAEEIFRQGKSPDFYIQVNTGYEPQKSGILPHNLMSFINLCRDQYSLNIQGLMCIPPIKDNPETHFKMLAKLGKETGITVLSMGMSNDYQVAIACGATEVRIGSALFGKRFER